MGLRDDSAIKDYVHVLACVECPRISTMTARGWRGYRIDDPDEGEPPAVTFYCPECAKREFGVAT